MKNRLNLKIKSKKRGSTLVFSLLILFIGLSMALGIASATVTSQRMSMDTGKSSKAYFAAESGLENMLLLIKNDSNDIDSLISGHCTSGKINDEVLVDSITYEVSFRNSSDVELNCNDTIDKVKTVISIATYGGLKRAVAADVPTP